MAVIWASGGGFGGKFAELGELGGRNKVGDRVNGQDGESDDGARQEGKRGAEIELTHQPFSLRSELATPRTSGRSRCVLPKP